MAGIVCVKCGSNDIPVSSHGNEYIPNIQFPCVIDEQADDVFSQRIRIGFPRNVPLCHSCRCHILEDFIIPKIRNKVTNLVETQSEIAGGE